MSCLSCASASCCARWCASSIRAIATAHSCFMRSIASWCVRHCLDAASTVAACFSVSRFTTLRNCAHSASSARILVIISALARFMRCISKCMARSSLAGMMMMMMMMENENTTLPELNFMQVLTHGIHGIHGMHGMHVHHIITYAFR